MEIRVHYLVTICALIFLGMMIVNPGLTRSGIKPGERICKMNKGRLDCLFVHGERIQKNSEVQYR